VVGSCAGRGGAGREAHPQEERQRRLPRLWCVWSGCTMMQHGTHSASLPFCQPACWPALWLAAVCPRAWVAAFHSHLAAPLPHAPDVYCAAVMPPLPAGFVRMARKEEAEVACQTVKEVRRCAGGPAPDHCANNCCIATQQRSASQRITVHFWHPLHCDGVTRVSDCAMHATRPFHPPFTPLLAVLRRPCGSLPSRRHPSA
jgi:hypothetical protein